MNNQEAIRVIKANYPTNRHLIAEALDVAIKALSKDTPNRIPIPDECGLKFYNTYIDGDMWVYFRENKSRLRVSNGWFNAESFSGTSTCPQPHHLEELPEDFDDYEVGKVYVTRYKTLSTDYELYLGAGKFAWVDNDGSINIATTSVHKYIVVPSEECC